MKSIIIYYSYSGNTRSVAQVLAEHLKARYKVEIVELKPLDETDKFISQGRRAHKHVRAQLGQAITDLSEYDLLCFGTPVWAFTTTPAINAYLDSCSGVAGKSVVLFSTSGGMGDGACLEYMQNILEAKGVKEFRKFSIQHKKARNREFVLSRIQETLG